jgi:hypothetical protein
MDAWRRLAVVLSLGLVVLCAALIVAPFFYQAGSLALARWRWSRGGAASYTVVVTHVCNCYDAGEYKLTVRDGQVVAAEPVSPAWMTGAIPPQRFNEYTVEAGFERAAQAVRANLGWRYYQLRITYDPELGYVSRFETGDPNAPYFFFVYSARDLELLE